MTIKDALYELEAQMRLELAEVVNHHKAELLAIEIKANTLEQTVRWMQRNYGKRVLWFMALSFVTGFMAAWMLFR